MCFYYVKSSVGVWGWMDNCLNSSGNFMKMKFSPFLLFVRDLDLKRTLNEYSGVERYSKSSRETEHWFRNTAENAY